MTIPELQEAYLDQLRGQRRSSSTLALNRRWLSGYFEFCAAQGVDQLAQLTPELLPAYYQNLLWRSDSSKGRRYAPNSLYQMLQMLRTFLRWAHTEGHLERDLVALVVLPRTFQTACLSLPELESLHRQLDPTTALGLRDSALMAVFYEAELSRDQAHRLDLADVRMPERQLVVHRSDGSQRLHALTDRLAEVLSPYLERGRPLLRPRAGEPAVFLTRSGLRLGSDAIGARIQALGQRAGLETTVHPRLLVRSGQAHRGPKR